MKMQDKVLVPDVIAHNASISKSLARARLKSSFCYVVKAWSSRDGGWVRQFGHFKKEQDAWDFIDMTIPLLELHKDIEGFNVVRTIRFR